MKNIQGLLLVGCSALALAGCGPDDIGSPGTGGNVIINNPTPTPTPTATVPATVTAAASGSCPSGTAEQSSVLAGPTGTWRVCRLPALITTSMTLPKIAGLIYEINGRVNVGCDGGFTAPVAGTPYTSSTVGCTTPLTADTNVTLSIAPGVILYGATGQSWLTVNRGNKIAANGNASQPIIFTSLSNVTGFDSSNAAISDSTQGQWGGVVLLGRAKTTGCTAGGSVASNTCERNTEGSADPAVFGGTDDTYNAGSMRFVQIRYSGFVLGAGSELQALTTGSVGSNTTLENIQTHNSSDDGAEFFGGAFNMKNYIATGADDDSIDVDMGARVNVQYAMLLPRPTRGDALMEIDSNNGETDTPRTNFKLANFIAIQSQTSSDNEANDQAAILLRGNSDNTFANGIIIAPANECIRMNGSGSTTDRVTLTARSVVMQCNATKYIGSGSTGIAFTAADVAAAFGSGSNNNSDAFTPTLATLFVNGTNEDAVPGFNLTTLSSFFTVASPNRIGAAWSGNTSWYTGWTCNSSTANFGSSSTACTALPTT